MDSETSAGVSFAEPGSEGLRFRKRICQFLCNLDGHCEVRHSSDRMKFISIAELFFLLSVFWVACSCVSFVAAAEIHKESFEDPPGSGYALSNQFDDAAFDFFGRYQVPTGGSSGREQFQLGWDGQYGILGQDHSGDGQDATQTVSIPGVLIDGRSNLVVKIAIAARAGEVNGFDNFEGAENDGIEIYVTIDGGARVLIGSFAPPAMSVNGGTNVGDLYLDSDLNQIGEGPRLTSVLSDFVFAVPGTGMSLDVEIEMTSAGSFEIAALDNVRVETVEPATAVDLPPDVQVTGKTKIRTSKKKVVLKGTAGDDNAVTSVVITYKKVKGNGKKKIVAKPASLAAGIWTAKFGASEGRNSLSIQAMDNAGQLSLAQKVKIIRRP